MKAKRRRHGVVCTGFLCLLLLVLAQAPAQAETMTRNTFMSDYGIDMAVDGSGNVYVTGSSTATWGSPINPHAGGGNYNAFLAKLNDAPDYTDADADGDGIFDAEDNCPESILTDTVIIKVCEECDSGVRNVVFEDGCTMSDLIAQCSGGEKDHGQFVSCVADLTNAWINAGYISGAEKGAIQSCAAKSNNCKDDNCDGLIDKDTFYRDADNDTFGSPSVTTLACSQPAGYVTNSDDCDDTVSGMGLITWYWDYDGDGYGRDSGAYCTVPIRACSKPEMYGVNFSELNTDCKDNDPARHPGATETFNGIDDDCDGQTDEGVQPTATATVMRR